MSQCCGGDKQIERTWRSSNAEELPADVAKTFGINKPKFEHRDVRKQVGYF